MGDLKGTEIYVIESIYTKSNDFTSVGISTECYTDLEKAIEFCKSRMTKEEIEKYENAVKRNLQNRFEFYTKNYIYYIKFLRIA